MSDKRSEAIAIAERRQRLGAGCSFKQKGAKSAPGEDAAHKCIWPPNAASSNGRYV